MAKKTANPTVITLTLPNEGGLSHTGTLLIQRGDLARLFQFHYVNMGDIASAIRDAQLRLAELEQQAPIVQADSAPTKPKPAEPTLDIPTQDGVLAVPMSYLKIVGGDADAAAYRCAVRLAGKLIDAQLWDGSHPIHVTNAVATFDRMKWLAVGELAQSTLSEWVQIPAAAEPTDDDEFADDEPVKPQPNRNQKALF